MRQEEERQLPFLCECGRLGCERCVRATAEELAQDLLFAPGHEPIRLALVADPER